MIKCERPKLITFTNPNIQKTHTKNPRSHQSQNTILTGGVGSQISVNLVQVPFFSQISFFNKIMCYHFFLGFSNPILKFNVRIWLKFCHNFKMFQNFLFESTSTVQLLQDQLNLFAVE